MEILPRIADALLINLSFIAVYIFLPLLVFHCRGSRDYRRPNISSLAAAAMCLQAVVGPLWSILAPASLHTIEPLLYFVLLFFLFRHFPCSSKTGTYSQTWRTPYFLLTLIVGIGTILRLIHPLQQAALGQSDAYSHLYLIRQIIETGTITNITYPPGYHWVMSLPAMLFPLDPYLTARYGGAFFGMLLILAIWNLASLAQHKTPAIIAAFLAACFPGSILLMKTAVGVYANQFGLFLLPVILTHYIMAGKKTNNSMLLLGLLIAGLITSVPMMIFNIALLITGDLGLRAARGKIHLPFTRFIFLSLMVLLPIIALLFFLQLHQDFFLSSAGIITSTKRPESVLAAIQTLTHNFVQLKRMGFGAPIYNTALIFLAFFVVASLSVAIHRKTRTFSLIAAWSLLTLVETATGIFQFSAYQRSGWELMITLCLLGGYVYWLLFEENKKLKQLRYVVLVLLFLSTLVSMRFYPRHVPVISNSENSIISLIRYLSWKSLQEAGMPSPFSFEQPDQPELEAVIPNLPTTLIMRQFTNFTHGDPIATLLGQQRGIKYIPIGMASKLPSIDNLKTTLVLLDSCFNENRQQDNSASHLMQPNQLHVFLTSRDNVCRVNDTLQHWVEDMDREAWEITLKSYNDMRLYFITPTR